MPPLPKLRKFRDQTFEDGVAEHERSAWETFVRSIRESVNQVTVSNVRGVALSLLRGDHWRARRFIARFIIDAQSRTPHVSDAYSAIIAMLNSECPLIGVFLSRTVVLELAGGLSRGNKPACVAAARPLAHMISQEVAKEYFACETCPCSWRTRRMIHSSSRSHFWTRRDPSLATMYSKITSWSVKRLQKIRLQGAVGALRENIMRAWIEAHRRGFVGRVFVIPDSLNVVRVAYRKSHRLARAQVINDEDIFVARRAGSPI